MSDLSNIGFCVETEEEFVNSIEKLFELASQIEVPWCFYIYIIDSGRILEQIGVKYSYL